MQKLRLLLWATVALVAFAVGGVMIARWLDVDLAGGMRAQVTPVPAIGGAFSLVDTEGRRVSDADLKGKPAAMFFGFTHCPDVCPTTLVEASAWLKALGPDAEKLRVVFVSVDPERDTPELLKAYLSSFDARITGLTGTVAEVDAIKKAYRVFARKVPQGATYTVDHSASVYLMDADGRFTGTIAWQEAPESALAKLRRLVGG